MASNKKLLVASHLLATSAIAPTLSAAPSITQAVVGMPVAWSAAGAITGTAPVAVFYDVFVGATLVYAHANSGVYIAANTGDSITVRQTVRNIAGSATQTSSAAVVAATGSTDADVTAYVTAVATAGGSLPTVQQTALNAIAILKASGAWPLIKELHLPLGADGDLITASVKFKNGATSPTVTLTNFVAGDYTVALGIYPGSSNSSKKITTDFAPSVNGSLTASEWGFSSYTTKLATGGVTMGMTSNSNAFLMFFSAPGQSKIGGTIITLQPTTDLGELFNTLRLQTVQITGGSGYAYVGGYVKNKLTIGSPGSLPTGGMCMLALNSSFFSNAAVSGYAIHAPMNPEQLRSLQTFFDTVCGAIGRTIFAQTLYAAGDSYVATPTPTGPSTPANCFVDLVCATKGWTQARAGSPGRGFAYPCSGGYWTGPTTFPGEVGRNTVFGFFAKPSAHVLIPLGLNDAFQNSTLTAVEASMAPVFDIIAAVGYPSGSIAVGTGYWSSAVTDQNFAIAIQQFQIAMAARYGFRVVDFYSGSTNGVTSVEVGVHKNDAGHVLLKNDVLNAISAGSWPGW